MAIEAVSGDVELATRVAAPVARYGSRPLTETGSTDMIHNHS
jgi:hypothetical protein